HAMLPLLAETGGVEPPDVRARPVRRAGEEANEPDGLPALLRGELLERRPQGPERDVGAARGILEEEVAQERVEVRDVEALAVGGERAVEPAHADGQPERRADLVHEYPETELSPDGPCLDRAAPELLVGTADDRLGDAG